MAASALKDMIAAFETMPDADRREFTTMVTEATKDMTWVPNPGPQSDAYFSQADELFYGGGAGGGKTDLLVGLSLTTHTRSLILRREGTDLGAIESRYEEVIGHRDGYNSQKKIWKLGEKFIELGSCPHEKDKFSYQGQPHDGKFFDELTQFTESQYRYITGWNRTTRANQRCRIVAAGNPPSTAEGMWVKKRWGPWLDPQYPHPAEPGELCWFTTIQGDDVEVDFDWTGIDEEGNVILPKSRTFIPALLNDNPFVNAEYRATLQGLPEPLRSQLLYGDFQIAEKDAWNQIIPTKWVRDAMARWTPEGRKRKMISIAADIAQGGDAKCSYARRHDGSWIDELITQPGKENTDGSQAAGRIVAIIRDRAYVVPDMGGGYGAAVSLRLRDANVRVSPFIPAGRASKVTKDGSLKFVNMRAQAWWGAREKLDPGNPEPWSLPPDEEMLADLTAPTWRTSAGGIVVEDKQAVSIRLGRSTDKGDSIVMAMDADAGPITVEEAKEMAERQRTMAGSDWDPYSTGV